MSDPASSGLPTQSRLHRLVEANARLVARLPPEALLREVVETAAGLVEARVALLAVAGPDGTLEQMAETGTGGVVSRESAAALVGALLGVPHPVRLHDLPQHPHLQRLADDPAVTGLLAVPLRGETGLQGVLCVADPRQANAFDAEDECLLTGYGTAAAVALVNSRRYLDARRRQHWLEASAEVSHRLIEQDTDVAVLELIGDAVARLAAADTVQIVLPVPGQEDTLEFAVSRGPGAAHAQGLRYPAAGSIAAEAMESEEGLVLNGARERLERYADERSRLPITDLLAFPLRGRHRPRGCVVVCRADSRPFNAEDVELARSFTNQAAVALELADARTNRSRLELLEERTRIARGLHDHALQQMFSAGLTLHGAATITAEPAVSTRILTAVSTLDEAIENIRASVFEL